MRRRRNSLNSTLHSDFWIVPRPQRAEHRSARFTSLIGSFLVAVVIASGCGSGVEVADGDRIDVSGVSIFQEEEPEIDPNETETKDPDQDDNLDPEPVPDQAEAQAQDDLEGAAEAGQVAVPSNADGLEGDDLEAFIAARYEAYWEAFDAARRSPSPNPSADHPSLLDLAAGKQLQQSYAQVIALFEIGEALRESDKPLIGGTDSGTEHRVRVELVDEALATVVACTVADDERYNVATDETVEQNVLSVESTSTMVIAEGEWKIIRAKATAIESGVGGCWLEGDDVYPY